jgi:prophage antirepressor-like protein
MQKITHVWFVTEMNLYNLAHKLGMVNIEEDAENFWEWVTGELMGVTLDITRTHTVPPTKTDTRIFLLDKNNYFPDELLDILTKKLKILQISPLYLGSVKYISGNDFESHPVKVIN